MVLSHGSSPRACHGLRAHVPRIHDLEGLEEFLTKQGTAPTIIRQGSQGREDREMPRHAPEVGFHAPEGHNHAWRYAVFGANLLQQGAVLVEEAQPFLHPCSREHALQVLGIGERLLGLFTVQLNDAWERLQSGKRCVKRLRADPESHSFGTQVLQPCGKAAFLGRASLTPGEHDHPADTGEHP